MALPVGKLPSKCLERLLRRCRPDSRVLLGPGIGRDAAALAMGDSTVVATTDPITFATDRIGWYAVNVNANDVACLGARPCFFLVTILLPEGQATEGMAESIFDDVERSCSALDITLCGGHTEVTYGLDRPIVVGQMLGEVEPDRLVRSDRCRAGDDVLLTRGIAIEGTALIAREKARELADVVDAATLDRAQALLESPGLCVLPAAQAICQAVLPHALHDPTEGGLATGLHELADAASLGMVIDTVPILPETETVCRHFGLDPLGLIASGSLLAVTAPEDTQPALRALDAAGVPAVRIGWMTPRDEGVMLQRMDVREPRPRFDTDEVVRLFT